MRRAADAVRGLDALALTLHQSNRFGAIHKAPRRRASTQPS